MVEIAPDLDRALWTVVSHIVSLYDDEPLTQEWAAGVNVTGRLHRAGVALALWYKARWPLSRNDDFHYAGYYTDQESSAVGPFIAVMKYLDYDHENRATNFAAIRDQFDDPTLLPPYFFLQRLIPILNEKGITLQVKQILETLAAWLNQNQLVWFADDPEHPDFVAVYSTAMDLELNPTERLLTYHWYTIVGTLRLFLPIEFCEYIRRNGEGHHQFMAVLAPYQALGGTFAR